MAFTINIVEPGTIGDYSDLENMIAQWLDRDDLGPQIPKFIAMTEARLNRLLRTLNMEVQTLIVANGESTPLPGDFRMLRSLHVEGQPDRGLREMVPAAVPNDISGIAGQPVAYWLRDRNLILAPPPSSQVTLNCVYYRRVPPLTAAEPLNWLLQEHPDLYVWGALHQAALYIRDPEAVGATKELLDEAIAELQSSARRDRYGGGPLVPNTMRQVRGGRC